MSFDADAIAEWKSSETEASLKADPQASFEGTATLSIETGADRPLEFDWLVVDDFAAFMRFIRPLPPRERDAVLSYYVLGMSQTQIAKALDIPQQSTVAATLMSARRRLSGPQNKRANRFEHETIVRKDPDHLGNFRVTVAQSADVLSDRSAVA